MADRDATERFGGGVSGDREAEAAWQAQPRRGNPGPARPHSGKQTESQKHEGGGNSALIIFSPFIT